jgi:hypothetical protein
MSLGRSTKEVPPTRRNLELLCRVKLAEPIASSPHGSFGNIIELGSGSLLLEAGREYAVGDHIVIEVVFPGQKRKGDPVSPLHCTIRKVNDEPALHYAVDIVRMGEIAQERLEEYLNRAAQRARDERGVR